MIEFEYLWKDTYQSHPSNIYGFGLGIEEKPPAVNVNTDILFEGFKSGLKKYNKIWAQVNPNPEMIEINKLVKVSDKKNFVFPTILWARNLFNFAVAYRDNQIERNQLIESMIPFYHARVLSFVNRTETYGVKEAEEYLENINHIFETEKYYLN